MLDVMPTKRAVETPVAPKPKDFAAPPEATLLLRSLLARLDADARLERPRFLGIVSDAERQALRQLLDHAERQPCGSTEDTAKPSPPTVTPPARVSPGVDNSSATNRRRLDSLKQEISQVSLSLHEEPDAGSGRLPQSEVSRQRRRAALPFAAVRRLYPGPALPIRNCLQAPNKGGARSSRDRGRAGRPWGSHAGPTTLSRFVMSSIDANPHAAGEPVGRLREPDVDLMQPVAVHRPGAPGGFRDRFTFRSRAGATPRSAAARADASSAGRRAAGAASGSTGCRPTAS